MTQMSDVERAQAVADLGFIEVGVVSVDYETEIVDGTGDQVPELVVHLSTDEEGRPRTLRLSFIPTGDDVEFIAFLQMYSPLPFTAPTDRVDEVHQAVAIINEHLAIGRFGVHDDGTLYFRYVLAAPKHTMFDDDMIGELVLFVDYHQENFGDYLEGVCEGEVSLAVLADVIAQAG